uniref:Short coiled-coil protein n=2 Tax=Denticeps clupeoides TaxID=299321 RepID=A0AAY4AIH7_9TELE
NSPGRFLYFLRRRRRRGPRIAFSARSDAAFNWRVRGLSGEASLCRHLSVSRRHVVWPAGRRQLALARLDIRGADKSLHENKTSPCTYGYSRSGPDGRRQQDPSDCGPAALYSKESNEAFIMNCDLEGDMENQVEMEEKTRLINQVLELQHTLEDLSARVDAVKEENLKLKSENQVLGQYIENLMSASSVFQTTDTKGKRK